MSHTEGRSTFTVLHNRTIDELEGSLEVHFENSRSLLPLFFAPHPVQPLNTVLTRVFITPKGTRHPKRRFMCL